MGSTASWGHVVRLGKQHNATRICQRWQMSTAEPTSISRLSPCAEFRYCGRKQDVDDRCCPRTMTGIAVISNVRQALVPAIGLRAVRFGHNYSLYLCVSLYLFLFELRLVISPSRGRRDSIGVPAASLPCYLTLTCLLVMGCTCECHVYGQNHSMNKGIIVSGRQSCPRILASTLPPLWLRMALSESVLGFSLPSTNVCPPP